MASKYVKPEIRTLEASELMDCLGPANALGSSPGLERIRVKGRPRE